MDREQVVEQSEDTCVGCGVILVVVDLGDGVEVACGCASVSALV